MNIVETYTATIFCGFKAGYENREPVNPFSLAESICQRYCNEVGFCVTVEPTRFIYKHGQENGVRVGLINYPRFPKTPAEIKKHAIEIATLLKDTFEQHRVSIVCTDETIMLGAK